MNKQQGINIEYPNISNLPPVVFETRVVHNYLFRFFYSQTQLSQDNQLLLLLLELYSSNDLIGILILNRVLTALDTLFNILY